MPPVGMERHFEVLTAVTALAEERGSIPLAEAAALVDVRASELRTLLEPLLFLEFYVAGHYVGESRAFLLDERDVLQLDDGHWLRDLQAEPPDRDTALRLLVAGLVFQAVSAEPRPALDRALDTLAAHVSAALVVPIDRPPCLGAVETACATGRSLRFRYVRQAHADASDEEILPFAVFSRWGAWYVHGRPVGGREPKHYRVDRMVTAELGDEHFDPPAPVDPPEWFDLTAHERRVTVRVPAALVESLPRPHTVERRVDLDGDRCELDLCVAGDRMLDHLLVALGPRGEVVGPAEHAARRAAWAATLLTTVAPEPEA